MTIRMKHQSVIVILNLFIILVVSGCQSDKKQAMDYFESAKKYYDEGQYSLASVEIKNAIKKDSTFIDPYMLQSKIFEHRKEWEAMHAFLATTLQHQPKHIEANLEIAKLYAKGQNFISAQRHLDTAIEGGADKFDQHLVQGLIYMNDQKLEQAMEQANAALAIQPMSVDAMVLYSSLLTQQERYDEALKVTTEVQIAHPDSEELFLIKSKIYSMQKKFVEAAKQAKNLTRLFPKELNYHYLLAALYDRANDKENAEKALKNATKENPENPKAKIALAGYISQQNRAQAAIDLLALYIESDNSTGNEELQLILAELYEREGQIQKASDIYKNLSNTNNKFSLSAKNKLALIALKDKRTEDALNILNDVLNSDFSNIEALIARSIIHLSDRRTDQAITDLLSAIREDAESELALMLLSRAYKQNNNNKQAYQTLKKLLKLNPLHQEAVLQFSQMSYQEKNYDASIKVLLQYMNNTKPSVVIQQNLMNSYLANSNWEQATQLAKTISETSNQPEYSNYTAAIIFQLKKQYNNSTQILKTLLEKNVLMHQSLRAIINNYRKMGNIDEGLQFAQAYLKDHPNDLFTVNLLISEYRRDQQYDKAETTILKALEANKDWSNGHLQLAKLYAAQAKWSEAIDSGLKAISDEKSQASLDTLLLLASSYEHVKNDAQAEVFYRKALKLSPNIQFAANNLALLLANDETNRSRINEAFEIAKQFEQSNQPLFIDTLGWIYFLRGEYKKAVILLEKAVFGAPEEAVIHYHLGATLYKLSEFKKAQKHLKKSQELGKKQSDFKEYQSAKILLDKIT